MQDNLLYPRTFNLSYIHILEMSGCHYLKFNICTFNICSIGQLSAVGMQSRVIRVTKYIPST